MTVSAQTPINRSTGNGVTTVFPYTFKIISDGDIEVSVDDVVKTLNVDYTVSGAGVDAGGNVTMTTAPANLTTVVRRRNMALVRTTDYQDQGTLPAATLDSDIDATVLMVQQLDERLDRTFSLPASFSGVSAFPAPVGGYVLGWDALGKNLTNLPASAGTSLIDLAASSGSSLIGYLPAGMGAVVTTVQAKLRESVSVKDFGAVGDGVTNDTAAIQNAINSVATAGGVVYIPAGQYKLTSMITMASGVSLVGDGQIQGTVANRQAVTSLLGAHTGVAILSLKGCIGCTISDLGLQSLVTNAPQFGLLLGRSSSASAGYHKINRVSVYGYYTKAAVYSIASENNTWDSLNVYLNGGGAKYCIYTGISDALNSGLSLVASSNLENTFIHPMFFSSAEDADSACIFIQGAQAVGSWSFIGGYLTAYAGSYIHIDNGSVDAQSMLGPITFIGMSGEILFGGDPLYVLRLTCTGAAALPGLTFISGRFALLAGTNHYQIIQPGNLTLESPNIHITPPEAFPYALCSFQRQLIKNGNVIAGRYTQPTNITLSGDFINALGPPFAPAAYSIDSQGVVRFQGTVTGTTGNICTLPDEYRPTVNMFFSTMANGAVCRILVTASTGVVSISSGSGTDVDLSAIQYKIN